MPTHQFNPNMRPDSDFVSDSFEYLVSGNRCRLLDPRRTPGHVERVCDDTAMFRWRISDFEDEGKCWDLPLGRVSDFQFAKNCQRLSASAATKLRNLEKRFDKPLVIKLAERDAIESKLKIQHAMQEALDWLKTSSALVNKVPDLDVESQKDASTIQSDFLAYMERHGLEELEQRTSTTYVLNPNSGEWFKGIEIVMAEMGLGTYAGTIPRTKDIFHGSGTKERRRAYIVARLAFVRALFSFYGKADVTLYRGMKTESALKKTHKIFESWTFNRDVAQSFTSFDPESPFKSSYLLKRTVPVERLFMTCAETQAMTDQYNEFEAVIFQDEGDTILF